MDFVSNSVRVTPEKRSNARILRISNKLIDMLNELSKQSLKIFDANSDAMRKSYRLQRKRVSTKLRNPRLLQITFHTFRHWKATMEYHKTRDILHVMQMLGHRNIKNTLIYTQLIDFKDDEFVARVASSQKDICQLIEAGFGYVCDYNDHRSSGNANNPYKKNFKVRGLSVAGGVGFEPTTTGLGGLRPILTRLPAHFFSLKKPPALKFWSSKS